MIEFFAEIGSNYITDKGPSFSRAIALIDTAASVGCTGVKFQYYKANDLWHPSMIKELEIAEKRELPFDWIPKLSAHARKKKLLFGLSVFDESSVELVNEHVDYFKIASFEISKFELIEKCYLTGKRLMLSMGQCGKEEIIELLLNLPKVDNTEDKTVQINTNVDILHCVSEYPASPEKCNLSIIKNERWINGWSDHTVDGFVISTAIACGAKIIEFHLDLDDGEGLEMLHSWDSYDILREIEESSCIEEILGTPSWNVIKANQDHKYKADPKTGLRGK